ncbi:hypothetical protein [Cryobacterium sp. 10C3]|uniref:hypothetical protein n=1 Tax=Cryobacterium sp. 10C3 TaxID=3048577 RepID=UPI002AB3D7AD|nr:hypothetical protein [Cryobacterium sp. 10C3]MDY7558316.1 hypothetical protein [Cryobacterium sp. 10C3]
MCGIIACRAIEPAPGYLVAGLKRLEYRGYDSAGIAVSAEDGTTAVFRTISRVDSLTGLVEEWGGPCSQAPASATPAGPPTAA